MYGRIVRSYYLLMTSSLTKLIFTHGKDTQSYPSSSHVVVVKANLCCKMYSVPFAIVQIFSLFLPPLANGEKRAGVVVFGPTTAPGWHREEGRCKDSFNRLEKVTI